MTTSWISLPMGIINFFLCTHEFILDGGLAHSCARWWKYSPPPPHIPHSLLLTLYLLSKHFTKHLSPSNESTQHFKCKQTSHHSISPTRLGFYFLYKLATYTSPYIFVLKMLWYYKSCPLSSHPKYCSKCTSCFSLLCTSFVFIVL
jgi:hypothetical protein